MPNPLLIRADAGPQRGLGHIMRTLALAQAWRATGGAVYFAVAEGAAIIEAPLVAAGCVVEPLAVAPGSAADAAATRAMAAQCGAEWLVLDGYHFNPDYQRVVRADGPPLLLLDDYAHWPQYHADLLWNAVAGSGSAGAALLTAYAVQAPGVALLAGPQYALLRREFEPWICRERTWAPHVARVVVSCGGSDATGLVAAWLRAFESIDDASLDITVVLGAARAPDAALQSLAANSPHRVQWLVNPINLPELFANADLACATASQTAWELAALGTPSLVGTTAANQRCLAAALAEASVVRHVGEWPSDATAAAMSTALRALLADAAARVRIGQAGRALVDGDGAVRVVQRLQRAPLRLRRVRHGDDRRLWEWVNEPTTRAMSFSAEPIPWATHVAWLAARLHDPDCAFYLGVDTDDQPIGQWRVDRIHDEGVVSVGLAPQARGCGMGSALIAAGTRHVAYVMGLRRFHAYIRPDNAASVAAFTKAGYVEIEPTQLKDQPARHFVCDAVS
ncbi:MAG: UDP-2,4-diacetamido-2,4,6-trideoxy-beta-L-altropyranose hydrolase [Deltaproteobacteria bacterium]|nr:UDP-2,4-diacetamido-2,4,6-trideoxy-beta-L-altropyranose hydrolase [Deltaproteobacteria bacterium]